MSNMSWAFAWKQIAHHSSEFAKANSLLREVVGERLTYRKQRGQSKYLFESWDSPRLHESNPYIQGAMQAARSPHLVMDAFGHAASTTP